MPPTHRDIVATAYCRCGHCCKWEWGVRLPGPFYLGFAPSLIPVRFRKRVKGFSPSRIPLLGKYWTDTNLLGQRYEGMTARGTYPAQSRPAILSPMSLQHPTKIPGRIVFFPWRFLPRHGTIAADTTHFPFGTRMYVPGYGWGVVEDRGSAIKGHARIDLYHHSHADALQWGRRKVRVLVMKPGQSLVDDFPVPPPVRVVLKGLDWVRRLVF
eukprot:TRINITY_DN13406_c0_g1_i1.p1 TRINITY_DN13406_c0_g1~~TRINITY_DN13406_c0_g1_i1.p1  ORF type:complete len:212 (-),score=13.66 TRINITY_DN13406_c0_g1_i1:769-1404(-)